MIRSTRRWRLPALLALGALTAGSVVLTAGSAHALPEFSLTRLFGPDRAGTAADIAVKSFPGGSSEAIIVREDDFADALSGNYLAGALDAPILLTGTDAVPASTLQAIDTLNVDHVTLLGGTTAIGTTVEVALQTLLGADGVDRIAGSDRFDTAARVAAAAAQLPSGVGEMNGEKVAVVSSGRNFPDALSAGPIVFSEHFPQLLTEPGSLPAQTAGILSALEIDRVILTGGTTAVAASVEAELTGAGVSTVQRIFGDTRYDTSRALAVFAGTNFGYSAEHVNFATGENFPDALAGGPHAGGEDPDPAAIILTPNVASGGQFTSLCSFLENLDDSLKSAHVFGGTVAVPDAVVSALTDCGNGQGGPAAGTGQVVEVDTANKTYTFVQDSDDAVITVVYDDQDTFTVDGAGSSVNAFESAITPGDTITFTDDTSNADADTHALTNVTVTSGMVGDVDITTNTFWIINDVTGDRVGGPFVYDELTDNLGGPPAVFEGDISEGDTVSVSEDPNTHVKTITLTNGSITGEVTDLGFIGFHAFFLVDHTFGDQFDSSVLPDDTAFLASLVPVTGTEAYTVDGQTKDFADFVAALSEGDTITVSRAGNVETFALTNAAPPVKSGQAQQGIDTVAETFTFITADGEAVMVGYGASGLQITVNGVLGTQDDIEARYTPGDAITYQAADAATSTTAKLTLTDQTLKGQIANIDTVAASYQVLSANNHEILATITYTDPPSPEYYVNGTEVGLAEFQNKLTAVVANGTTPEELDDTIEFIPGGLHNEHRLTSDDT